MQPFIRQAEALAGDMRATMATLHQRPELSFAEHETTALIRGRLAALGLAVHTLGMETGAVGVLRGAQPGPLVAVRADIDAIAETERSSSPHPSRVPGVMHACGHDVHTTCALAAAELLARHKGQMHGDVAFLFQPAEEVTKGAAAMLEHGLLKTLGRPVEALFGMHVNTGLAAGIVGASAGPVAAGKQNFKITLTGRAGHGGFPHQCVDVVVAGAALTTSLQTVVSRNTNPFEALVLALYSVQAGSGGFFVTDTLTLTGALRALSADVLAMAHRRVEEMTAATAAAYGCTAAVEWVQEVPPLVNDAALEPLARRAAAAVANEVTATPPMLGSDDFAVFGEGMPCFYYALGTGFAGRHNAGLHAPDFCADPAALPVGAALLAESAWRALHEPAQ